MINPKVLFQLKSMLERFQQNHPKVPQFFQAAAGAVDEGSVIEITLTTSQGQTLCTNMRVCAEDLEMFRTLGSQIGKS